MDPQDLRSSRQRDVCGLVVGGLTLKLGLQIGLKRNASLLKDGPDDRDPGLRDPLEGDLVVSGEGIPARPLVQSR